MKRGIVQPPWQTDISEPKAPQHQKVDYLNNRKIANNTPNRNYNFNSQRAKTDPFGINNNNQDQKASAATPSKLILNKLKQARTNGVIDISNIHATEIPKEIFDPNVSIQDVNWWEMVDITKLDASNNEWSENSFDNEERNLSLLSFWVSLRLANNHFNYLPDSLYQLSNLKLLDVSNNKITHWSSQHLRSLCSLVEWDVSNNQINEIPDQIQFLTYLEVWRMSFNKIIALPPGMGSLYRLKKWFLDNNIINIIPLNIFLNLTMLEEWYLFKNRIEHISDPYSGLNWFDNAKNLKFVDLHCNSIQHIQFNCTMDRIDALLWSYNRWVAIQGWDRLCNLTNLDLNNNKLENFPKEIMKLKKLNTLNLQNNSINELPNTWGLMSNLVRLNIEGNPWKRLVTKMKSANTEEIKRYLKTRITPEDLDNYDNVIDKNDIYDIGINMKDGSNANNVDNIATYIINNGWIMKKMNLSFIPSDDIKNNIKKNSWDKFDLSENKIADLSPFHSFVDIIQSLKEINFEKNAISQFPIVWLSLPNWLSLNVSRNKIEYFPYEELTSSNIGDIRCSLTYFDISFNELKAVPEVLGWFTALSTLIIANNKLWHLNNIEQMKFTVLDTINIGNNKLEKLPMKLYRSIPNVKCFVAENNNIKDIPTDFCLLFNWNVVNFYGNAIKKIRNNLLANAKGLLEYLKRVHCYDNEDKQIEDSYTFKNNVVPKGNSWSTGNDINVKAGNNGLSGGGSTLGKNSNLMINNNNNNNIQQGNQNKNDKPPERAVSWSNQQAIDKWNIEIQRIESEMAVPNWVAWKKTDLRKELHAWIRQRGQYYK